MPSRRAAECLVGLAILLTASAARAADWDDVDSGFFGFELFSTVYSVPSLPVSSNVSPRFVGIAAPSGTDFLLGGAADIEYRMGPLLFDIGSVRYAGGIGTGTSFTTQADGQSVSVSRSPVQMVEFGLPAPWILSGFQVFPKPTWKVSFRMEYGVELTWADAAISGLGVRGAQGSIEDWDWFVRSKLSVCRWLKDFRGYGASWGCVEASPTVYEKSWFPGISLGVRVDI